MATQQVKPEGLLDNLKNLNFSQVVTLVEQGAADAVAKNWLGLLTDVGSLALAFGHLGDAGGIPVPMACPPDQCDKFDAACQSFEAAKSSCHSIPPQAGPDGQPAGIDPTAILTAMELFSQLIAMFKAWRTRPAPATT